HTNEMKRNHSTHKKAQSMPRFWERREAALGPLRDKSYSPSEARKRLEERLEKQIAAYEQRPFSPEEGNALRKVIMRFGDFYQELEGLAPEEVTKKFENSHKLTSAYQAYNEAVVEAIRMGLEDFPLVSEWIVSKRRQGDWDTLRKAKRGLETEVERPLG